MMLTGKRHDFLVDYDVGFDDAGRILAVDRRSGARAAACRPICRAGQRPRDVPCRQRLFLSRMSSSARIAARPTPSRNTAFRGFGGPQGMMVIERLIEEIASPSGQDPLAVRKAQFLRQAAATYALPQTVEDNDPAEDLRRTGGAAATTQRRREKVAGVRTRRTARSERGIALTPVKFGISLHRDPCTIRPARWCTSTPTARACSITAAPRWGRGCTSRSRRSSPTRFRSTRPHQDHATTTAKVPNTSATAASSGTRPQRQGRAGRLRADQGAPRALPLPRRIDVTREEIAFVRNHVVLRRRQSFAFDELIAAAYAARVHLSATGFYATPKIHWDSAEGRGRPFYYFAYGAACRRGRVDTLTGEYAVAARRYPARRRPLAQSGDRSGPDRGRLRAGHGLAHQRGAVVGRQGRLRTHAPSTYKIPLASDRARRSSTSGSPNGRQRGAPIYRSKAVGEPPLMLGISVFEAIGMAVASVGGYRRAPRLDAPATPERVLMACERLREEAGR